MKRSQDLFFIRHIVSSVFMVLALLWLTISTPFVYSTQQKQIQKEQKYQSNNSFSNTTEEKNESGVNTLSEYLHDQPSLENSCTLLVRLYKRYPSKIYYEYHPELLSPPPEA